MQTIFTDLRSHSRAILASGAANLAPAWPPGDTEHMRTFAPFHLHHATWLVSLALVACSGPAADRGAHAPKAVISERPAPFAPPVVSAPSTTPATTAEPENVPEETAKEVEPVDTRP